MRLGVRGARVWVYLSTSIGSLGFILDNCAISRCDRFALTSIFWSASLIFWSPTAEGQCSMEMGVRDASTSFPTLNLAFLKINSNQCELWEQGRTKIRNYDRSWFTYEVLEVSDKYRWILSATLNIRLSRFQGSHDHLYKTLTGSYILFERLGVKKNIVNRVRVIVFICWTTYLIYVSIGSVKLVIMLHLKYNRNFNKILINYI